MITNYDHYEDIITKIMKVDGDSIGVLKDTGEIVRCHEDHLNCRNCKFSGTMEPHDTCNKARARWFNTEYHIELKDDLSNLKEWCDYVGIVMKLDFDELETIHGASGLPYSFTRTGSNTSVVIKSAATSAIETGVSVPSYVSKATVKKILLNLVVQHLGTIDIIYGLDANRTALLKQIVSDLNACLGKLTNTKELLAD